MKNLMNKIRKANKGFTLVELIIVVAIIAVLTAVAAPQYIKYVERSKKASDINTAGAILSAAKVVAVDPDVDDDTFTVTWDTTGSGAAGDISVSGLTDGTAVTGVTGTTVKPVSKFATEATGVTEFVVTVTDGVATVSAYWATDLNSASTPTT